MMTISLTRGQLALVDDSDFEWLSQWRWYARWSPSTKTFYACREVMGKAILMHRIIMGDPVGVLVDHKKSGDTLNNQRNNLRVATKSQNGCNRGIPANNTSGFKGVSFHKRTGKWCAYIGIKGQKKMHLGLFNTPEAAHLMYKLAVDAYHGEFGRAG